jgi:hypothetical protein
LIRSELSGCSIFLGTTRSSEFSASMLPAISALQMATITIPQITHAQFHGIPLPFHDSGVFNMWHHSNLLFDKMR